MQEQRILKGTERGRISGMLLRKKLERCVWRVILKTFPRW